MSNRQFHIPPHFVIFAVALGLMFWTSSWPHPLTVEKPHKKTTSQSRYAVIFGGVQKLWWWLSGEYQEVPREKTQSLVGTPAERVRKQLGKPRRVVSVKSGKHPVTQNSPLGQDSPIVCDEIWTYSRVVPHVSSGTEFDLYLYFQNGTCRHAAVSNSGD